MGKVMKWVAIIIAIVVLAIVAYTMLLAPILERGWQG
jgi:hypothetical protein